MRGISRDGNYRRYDDEELPPWRIGAEDDEDEDEDPYDDYSDEDEVDGI